VGRGIVHIRRDDPCASPFQRQLYYTFGRHRARRHCARSRFSAIGSFAARCSIGPIGRVLAPGRGRATADNFRSLGAYPVIRPLHEETHALRCLADLKGDILLRYVEWLNAQRTAQGAPLSKATRAATYISLLKLLQWLARCRPGLLGDIVWPIKPFPWRNRDTRPRRGISAAQAREILKACEHDIAKVRVMREQSRALQQAARAAIENSPPLGWYRADLYWRGISRSNASAFLWAIFSRSSGDTGKFLRKATAAKLLPKG
jgi:hypothetical protein